MATSQELADKIEAARWEQYEDTRLSIDDSRILLALKAMRARIEQELVITLAGGEIDLVVDNPTYRVNKNIADTVQEVLTLQARLKATDSLIEQYELSEAVKQEEQASE